MFVLSLLCFHNRLEPTAFVLGCFLQCARLSLGPPHLGSCHFTLSHGSCSLTGFETKSRSPPSEPLVVLLATRKICISLSLCQSMPNQRRFESDESNLKFEVYTIGCLSSKFECVMLFVHVFAFVFVSLDSILVCIPSMTRLSICIRHMTTSDVYLKNTSAAGVRSSKIRVMGSERDRSISQ